MSKVFRDISSIDTMPSHVETPSRIFGHTVGKTTFRSRLASQDHERPNLQIGTSDFIENLTDRRLHPSSVQHGALALQSQLNEGLRAATLSQRPTMSRTFGLQLKNLPPSHTNSTFSHQDSGLHPKGAVSTVSRTFGLVPDTFTGVNTHKNDISSLDPRRYDSVNASLVPKTFGLQTRNLTMHSHFFSENDLRVNPELDLINCRRSNVSAVSRTFDVGAQRRAAGGGLNSCDNEGFIGDLRRNGSASSSLMAKPFGHHPRNLTVHSSLVVEGNPNCRMNTLSSSSEMFDSEGFRRPTLSRVIRGRNSLLSSRLFHGQNVDKHCRDLSNVNGFNVDSLSESRVAVIGRSNWTDNHSMAGSFLSMASMKGQFMNLLESLHHSILSIGPHATAEAVRMEFDKAKQGLESICEMSLAPSIREGDAASVVSQSSKYTCPPVTEPASDVVLDGGSFHLRSSREVLKSLISRKDDYRSKFTLPSHAEERAGGGAAQTTPSKDSDDEEVSGFFFKKPSQPSKKRKISRVAKSKSSGAVGSSSSKAASKALALKQWYPVADGSDLVLCGVDEKGVAVKTDPVKKRLSRRRVELVSGLVCSLVGSPSPMVSVLPKKISLLLKNGLTDKWRVLQVKLVNCQTGEKGRAKKKSKSPMGARSPQKAMAAESKADRRAAAKAEQSSPKAAMAVRRADKRKSRGRKVLVSPKRSGKGAEVFTRSGRAVKPPSPFWLVGRSIEISSSQTPTTPETTSAVRSPEEGYKRGDDEETSARIESPLRRIARDGEFLGVKTKRSRHSLQRKSEKAAASAKAEGKPPKAMSPRKNKKKESRATRTAASSTAGGKRQMGAGKRKREVGGDVDAVETKKSKVEKVMEAEAESTVEDADLATKEGRKKRGRPSLGGRSPKVKAKKSSPKKNYKKNKKRAAARESQSESRKKGKELNEFEEDFELHLDDIEIPEITNVSGNPRLSRSQLRVVSMETPPLKYFNSNLRLLGSATPMRSPDWCISQRSESEVKRFQKRREEAFKKRTRVDVKQTIVTEKTTRSVQGKELKRVMEWIAEKTVKSPAWNSRVVQYLMPSRKQREQQDDDDDDEQEENGAGDCEFQKPSFG